MDKKEYFYGLPCYSIIGILNLSSNRYKKIFEIFKLYTEDNAVETDDITTWYIVPKENGRYSEAYANRFDNLVELLRQNDFEVFPSTYVNSSWEDVINEKARKEIKKLIK